MKEQAVPPALQACTENVRESVPAMVAVELAHPPAPTPELRAKVMKQRRTILDVRSHGVRFLETKLVRERAEIADIPELRGVLAVRGHWDAFELLLPDHLGEEDFARCYRRIADDVIRLREHPAPPSLRVAGSRSDGVKALTRLLICLETGRRP